MRNKNHFVGVVRGLSGVVCGVSGVVVVCGVLCGVWCSNPKPHGASATIFSGGRWLEFCSNVEWICIPSWGQNFDPNRIRFGIKFGVYILIQIGSDLGSDLGSEF